LLKRLDAILGQQHLIAFARQQAAGDLAHGQRVIDDHDRGQAWR
jgi:hypothetical protein